MLCILCLLFIFFGFIKLHLFLIFAQLFGVIGFLYFAPILVYLLGAVLINKPGCIVSEEGITDQSQLYGSGFIRWDDIEKITIGNKHTVDFLSIHLREPENLIQNANPIKRQVLKLTAFLGFTTTIIDVSRLQISGPDLLISIEQYSNGRFFADEIPETNVDDWKV